ncbi:MAG: hypothetical protein Q4F95_07385 [Oscillospiraceae bacterium]|nr:hypothetical protein [Oscillospiraceae bacterium]
MTEEQLQKVDWLNRAFRTDQKVSALIAVQKQNKSLACRCTAVYDNNEHMNQEEILHKICDDSMRIDKLIDELIDTRKEIYSTITAVGDDELEAILYHRYLAYMSIQQIADIMHYDRKTIQRKHIKALDKIMSLNVAPTE